MMTKKWHINTQRANKPNKKKKNRESQRDATQSETIPVDKFINKIEMDYDMLWHKKGGCNFLRFYSFWCDIWYAVYVFSAICPTIETEKPFIQSVCEYAWL